MTVPVLFQVRKEILEDTAKRCVFPNRIAFAMSGQADVRRVKGFNPAGVLFVRVIKAEGLPKKGRVYEY